MPRSARVAAAAIAVALAVLVAPLREALAWVEVHVESDDVRVVLERTGDARVEHKITLRIAGGPLRSIDIRGVDADAAPDPEGYVVPQRAAEKGALGGAVQTVSERLPLDAKPRADGSPAPTVLRVRFDREKGLGRGIYVLFVRYATHLAARPDPQVASLWRVEWRGPVWEDGFDSAHVTFDLPAAPTEPRAAETTDPDDVGGGSRPPLVLSTVRRGTSRDQLELMRPYAPKGEAITWGMRADPRAFQPAGPKVGSSPPGVRRALDAIDGLDVGVTERARRGLLLAGALGLFVIYSVLVALKSSEAARCARAVGATASPLVPLPAVFRAVLAGASLVVGLFVELVLARATVGALFVLGAVLLAAHRSPRWPRPALRGPGRWLPITEATAYAAPPRPRGAYLDVSTRAGKAILLVALTALGALVAWLFETSPYRAELLALDATALLAIFCTGRIAELPPDPATAPAGLFRAIGARVRRAFPSGDVRLLGRIRVPDGATSADELRLAVALKSAPPGFVSLEIGAVHVQGTGGRIALPQVLVRVKSGSPCEAALEHLAPHARRAKGSRPGEATLLFTPRIPTARMTGDLVAGLLRVIVRCPEPRSAPATSQRRLSDRAA